MKKFILILLIFSHYFAFPQNIETYEKPPVFPECEQQSIENLKTCFNQKLNKYVFCRLQKMIWLGAELSLSLAHIGVDPGGSGGSDPPICFVGVRVCYGHPQY